MLWKIPEKVLFWNKSANLIIDIVSTCSIVTHGCIVATLKLYLPDGKEAKARWLEVPIPDIRAGLKCKACFYFFRSPSTGIQDEEEISELCKQDLYQLNQWIQVRNKIELPTNNVDFSTCWSIYRKLSFASKY